tara:strand:- start:36 stop:503 length:468 start_codon:yes stop_codon:yes gene_type:complete
MNDLEIELMQIVNGLVLRKDISVLNVKITGWKNTKKVEIIIQKNIGVTLDDCAFVSNIVDDVVKHNKSFMDLRDTSIEVSSPGINRELYSLDDFKLYIGERVIVKLKKSFGGLKNIKGIIIDVSVSNIIFKTNKGEVAIPYNIIQKANLNREIKV